jgi:hypothetical protein
VSGDLTLPSKWGCNIWGNEEGKMKDLEVKTILISELQIMN